MKILRKEVATPQSNIKYIEIQPCEDELLREKATLSKIGDLAKKIGAVILLEGGVLSHAYYLLIKTEAIVEVKHPFDEFEEKREFHKLVRDKVSLNIEQGGEYVNKVKLSGEILLRALKEKLVEESFEVLDADNIDSIVGELADVNEVIDGILNHISVTRKELEEKQQKKLEKAGGFKDGIVLIETRNPLPTNKNIFNNNVLFESVNINDDNIQTIAKNPPYMQDHKILKWSDKREYSAATEKILRITVPAIRDNWTASERISIKSDPEDSIQIHLLGTRQGSNYQIEISIFRNKYKQLTLFDIIDEDNK